MKHATFSSPIGQVTVVVNGDGALSALWLHDDPLPESRIGQPDQSATAEAVAQLRQYFAGERTVFDLPLAPVGTPFQLKVWQELRAIAYGHTISYAELARRIGQPTAARAVGLANSKNPISIVVPCHRVIGASGALTGYASGVARKRWLLHHERALGEPQPGLLELAGEVMK